MRAFVILICIFQFCGCFSQTNTFNIIDNPTKRLKSVYHYISRDLGIPENINDSTVFLTNKDDYYYDNNNRLIKIVSNIFESLNYGSFEKKLISTRIDSILYVKEDSIIRIKITLENGKKATWETKEKLFDYKTLIIGLPQYGTKKFDFIDSDGKLGQTVIKIKSGLISKIQYKSPEYTGNFNIFYDGKNRVKQIGKFSFSSYLNNSDFRVFESYGAFSGIFYFYFDSDGFLIKKTEKYDTNPDITIYDYETGKGNAMNFLYSINDLWKLRPLIY